MSQPTAAVVTLSRAAAAYIAAKRLEGYSPHTLKGYELQLRLLMRHVGDLPIAEVTLDHLRDYLSQQTHLKASSMGFRVRTLRAFFKWAHEEDLVLRNPSLKLKEPKQAKRVPKHLTVEEVELLRDACRSPLEHALVELMFATGCRVGEVHLIDRGDVDWQRRAIVVMGKGSKEREVYFGARAGIWLRRYLEERTDSDPALFVSQRRQRTASGELAHRRMSIYGIQHAVRRIAGRCGLEDRVTPHVLRHTLATVLLNQGAPLVAVQSILGHTKPETTQLYATLSGAARQRAYERYFVQ